jgi:hypothetical protein
MADASAKEFQEQFKARGLESEQASPRKEGERNIKEKYGNILKEKDLESSSLQIFFQRLAEKFGFEKEWERYHTENTS